MGAVIVDGNVLAGMLSEVFESDATMLAGVCGGCRDEALLAEAVVELDDEGAIVRCRSCTRTMFTVVRAADGIRVMFAALAELRRS